MNISLLIEKARPNLKKSSIANYTRNLKTLNNNESIQSLDFLYDVSEIKDKIASYSPTTKRNLITAILVILKSVDTKNKILEDYKNYMDELNLIINNTYSKKEKTKKESDNWMSLEELQTIQKNLANQVKAQNIENKNSLSPSDNKLLTNYLIASLYILQPSIRLEYASMSIITDKKDIEKDKNYLINSKNKLIFYLGNYKTISQHGIQEIKINNKLSKVIKLYLKFNTENKFFLKNSRGYKMSSNSLSKLITRVFQKDGKHVNLNLLRKAWVSSVVDVEQTKKEEDLAQAMLHTTDTQKEIYSKK